MTDSGKNGRLDAAFRSLHGGLEKSVENLQPFTLPSDLLDHEMMLRQYNVARVIQGKAEITAAEFMEAWGEPPDAMGQYVDWPQSGTFLYLHEDCGLYVRVETDGDWNARVYAYSADTIDRVQKGLRSVFPEISEEDPLSVNMSFVYYDGSATRRARRLAITPWELIQDNYPVAVREALVPVFDIKQPQGGGKLLLWYGPPGTGKSHAIRALAKQWEPWCHVTNVVDPEAFFGNAAYLTDVILTEHYSTPDKWQLIVAEDADDFLRADAKDRTGHGFSRLLNVADGMIGQGLNLLILITTNEKMSNIHEAVSRKGRCLADINFDKFKQPDANQWLRDRGQEPGKAWEHPEVSLAEMYDRLINGRVSEKKQPEFVSGTYL